MKLWPDDCVGTVLVDPVSERTLTYHELDTSIVATTRTLAFVWSDDGFDAARAYLELFGAGHAVFIGDARLAEEQRAALESRYSPGLVWTPEEGLRSFDVVADLHPDLALLLSTSGSTGAPKLVRLSYEAVRSNARAIADYLELGSDERAPLNLPLSYAYGLSVLHSHLVAGATLVTTGTNVIAREFWAAIEAEKCTSLAGVPYTWTMLLRLRLERLKLGSVRYVTQAGGALDTASKQAILEWADAHDAKFFVMYGQTEATARMSFMPPDKLASHIGSIGRAIPGGHLSLEPHDDTNELVYHGPNVMMGYAETRDDLARRDELGGRLSTGDLGWQDDDGFFYVGGRSSRFIKVFGHRIELDWLERELNARIDGDIAVVGRDDDIRIVIDDPGLVAELERIATELQLQRRALSVEVVDELPRGTSGKLNRGALEARVYPSIASDE